MVPNGWNDGRVEDLVSGLESGVSVNGEDRPLAKGEKGVLKVSAVSYGVFDEYAVKAVTSGEELKRAKTHPKKGQIIISRSNTEELVGASAYIESDFDSLFLPDKLWQTIPKPNSDMKWLSYVLASEHSRYTLSNLATGTSGSMKNITKGELLGLKVSIPPIPEQRKIAKILSTWDKAITTTEKLIATSKQQKKALMQQLLTGKKRLRSSPKDGAETGKTFEGDWEEVRLDSFITNFIVPMRDKPKDLTGEIPWCRIEDFSGMYLSKSKSNQGVSLATIEYMNLKVFPKNTLLVSCSADLGRCAITQNELVTNQTFIGLVTNEEVSDVRFLFYKIVYFAKKLNDLSSGTTISYLSRKEFEKFKVSQPDIEEQRKIASVLTSADKEIEVLEAKLVHFKQEKKALMQQLLTGKRRVKVDETESA